MDRNMADANLGTSTAKVTDCSSLLAALPLGVMLVSEAGSVLLANASAEQLLSEFKEPIAALLDSGGGFLHPAGVRLSTTPSSDGRWVTMEPVPLPSDVPLALIVARSGLVHRAAGKLSALVPVGESLLEMLDEADREDLEAVFEEGGGELELLLPAGQEVHILLCDIEHRPSMGGWLIRAQDRTHERRLQSALREAERRFLRLIEGIPVALLITDASGRSAYSNVRADALLGGIQFHQDTSLESILKTAQVRTSGEHTPYPMERLPMLRALRGERCSINDVEMLHDGHWIPLEITSAPVVGLDGEFIYVITILQDIRARRDLEQQLHRVQRMEAVGQLAGELAHDFNNFLTVISSCSQLALSTMSPDQPSRADLEEVVRTAHQAAGLTRQLLTISRRQPMTMRPLSLLGLLHRIERLLQRLIGDVSLNVSSGRGVWPVMADEGLLERVIINLTLNARDAMSETESPWLAISMENVVLDEEAAASLIDVLPGAYVVITFEDNGAGISPELLDRIFEPFFTTKTDSEGTGLGLSMVYGVIRQSGGYLSVDSALGQGTTFRIALPRAEWVAQTVESVDPVKQANGSILLIEDELAVRRSTMRMLRARGYDVHAVDGPESAIQYIQSDEANFDIIVSDVNLPGMRGDVLVEKLLEIRPGTAVLFISGSLLEETLLGQSLLTKPFTAEELGRRVAELLSKSA
jgi:two-component system cell cycle sensor histidine kinase/response regulator CckA